MLRRRSVCLVVTVLSLLGLSVGCGGDRQEPAAPQATVSEVPLRVALAGDEQQAEAIRRGWLAVSDQPLDVTALGAQPSDQQMVTAAQQHDVLIYPTAQTGQLIQEGAIRPLRKQFHADAERQTTEAEPTELLPALGDSLVRYGSESVGLPLGGPQPVLLRRPDGGPSPRQTTWTDYAQQVAQSDKGRAAEPLADGWAAQALLYRANGYCGSTWLFRGDELQPILATAPYLRALRELQQDAARYPSQRMTPAEIWQAVHEGNLDLAIAWPASPENLMESDLATRADVTLQPLPVGDPVYLDPERGWQDRGGRSDDHWVLLMGQAPMGSLAAGCRQTFVSESFLQWISGGEGSTGLPEAIAGFTVTRTTNNDLGADGGGPQTDYSQLLRTQLSGRFVRPPLRIPGADQYMQALDAEVQAVLAGEKTPETALIDASVAWEEITERYGRRQQAKHWRMTQGMSR